MKGLASAIFAGILLAAVAGSASAQTFSLAGNWNFSTDSTANLWAYGTSSGTFTGSNFVIPSTITSSGTSVEYWVFPPTPGGSDPNIEKNVSASDVLSSNVDFKPGEVSFGPYNGPAIAQFTAPSAGLFDISATFQTDQIRGTSTSDGTTAYVYVGGAQKFSQELFDPGHAQFGTAYTYTSNNVLLTLGEKVDFVLGGGAFTTQVDATLVELPEPSTWVMVAGGLVFVGLVRRRATLA